MADDTDPSWKDGIRTIWVDAFAIAAVIVSIVIIVQIYSIPYTVSQEKYPQLHRQEIVNPLYRNETMFLRVNMVAKTFSAHEDIEVSVELWPNYNQRARESFYLDETFRSINWSTAEYTIAFENTYCPTDDGSLAGCYFYLDPVEGQYKSALHTIKYSVGGSHDIYLTNRTITDTQFRQGELVSRVGKPFIQIDSISAINSLRQAETAFDAWKSVVTIAIIAALVGSLSLYQRIRPSLIKYLDLRERKKYQSSTSTEDEGSKDDE